MAFRITSGRMGGVVFAKRGTAAGGAGGAGSRPAGGNPEDDRRLHLSVAEIQAWIVEHRQELAQAEELNKAIAIGIAAGEYEPVRVSNAEFDQRASWRERILVRGVAKEVYVEANLGWVYGGVFRRNPNDLATGVWVPGAPTDRDTWLCYHDVYGRAAYFSDRSTFGNTLRTFAGDLMRGGDGALILAKLDPQARMITQDELDELPDLDDPESGFPPEPLHGVDVPDAVTKALWYGYDAIHVKPGSWEEQFVVMNRRALIVNEEFLPGPALTEMRARIKSAREARDEAFYASVVRAKVPVQKRKESLERELEEIEAEYREGLSKQERELLNEQRVSLGDEIRASSMNLWEIENHDTIAIVKNALFQTE